jgi:hypothetical protein
MLNVVAVVLLIAIAIILIRAARFGELERPWKKEPVTSYTCPHCGNMVLSDNTTGGCEKCWADNFEAASERMDAEVPDPPDDDSKAS